MSIQLHSRANNLDSVHIHTPSAQCVVLSCSTTRNPSALVGSSESFEATGCSAPQCNDGARARESQLNECCLWNARARPCGTLLTEAPFAFVGGNCCIHASLSRDKQTVEVRDCWVDRPPSPQADALNWHLKRSSAEGVARHWAVIDQRWCKNGSSPNARRYDRCDLGHSDVSAGGADTASAAQSPRAGLGSHL
jgi:hypothetical protein